MRIGALKQENSDFLGNTTQTAMPCLQKEAISLLSYCKGNSGLVWYDSREETAATVEGHKTWHTDRYSFTLANFTD